MVTSGLPGPEFSPRTGHMVGRQQELDRLRRYLNKRGDRHFMFYVAPGGLGKTRLLQELQELVQEAGRGYYTTGIIDFYHTDTHSTSDIERAIADGLDPRERYFPNYRAERYKFELLRERGTDPDVLEKRRAELSGSFVKDCRDMALDARKLVICFDTTEHLQYESSIVEEMAGLDAMDARVKPWLLDKLAQLNNVLVVFAGRPKKRAVGETLDPQARLEADMRQAFGDDLAIAHLGPLNLDETREFIDTLTRDLGVELIPSDLLPIFHRLIEGKPIFLHLVVDLLQTLSPEPRRILDLFERHKSLVDDPEESDSLQEARKDLQVELLKAVFNAADLGGYLEWIALMPKGVDAEILRQTLGLPEREGKSLLQRLEPLSFVKRFVAPPGAVRLHGERTFLHEEMYDLLTRPGVAADPADLEIKERNIAHGLTENYYGPKIAQLRQELGVAPTEKRVELRERLQKLQVERLYYLLIWNPRQGYAEYQTLTDEANSRRWVGFAMRLLDEFLRFFNEPRKREMVEKAGIPSEQVTRDSARMWVERFWWWGNYERVQGFAQRILADPASVSIRPEKDADILGNIFALWARSFALLEGYTEEAVQQAKAMLERLPPLTDCNPSQALARARMLGTIGYHLRLGGRLQEAVQAYAESLASFRRAGGHLDEQSMVQNSLAYAYALQGRFVQARMLAHDALRMNEKLGYERATGLILSSLTKIAQMRGNYPRALEHGREALDLFQRVDDPHGIVLAYQGLAQATRRLGKHESQLGRRPEEAQKRLQGAIGYLQRAEEVLQNAGMGSERLLPLYAELGRAHRDMGNLLKSQGEGKEALRHYHEAERTLERALDDRLPHIERASVLEDLAETQFMAGQTEKAHATVAKVEALIGSEYRVIPGKQVPAEGLATEYFAPLGKIELLRGQMAFEEGRLEEGVDHYLLAYAYFRYFSKDAVELDTLMGYLYTRLQGLPSSKHAGLMTAVHKTIGEKNFGVDMSSFVKILGDLLGV